jgi:hypothetical protein
MGWLSTTVQGHGNVAHPTPKPLPLKGRGLQWAGVGNPEKGR